MFSFSQAQYLPSHKYLLTEAGGFDRGFQHVPKVPTWSHPTPGILLMLIDNIGKLCLYWEKLDLSKTQYNVFVMHGGRNGGQYRSLISYILEVNIDMWTIVETEGRDIRAYRHTYMHTYILNLDVWSAKWVKKDTVHSHHVYFMDTVYISRSP